MTLNFITREFDYEGVLVDNEHTDQIDLWLDDGSVLSLEEVLGISVGHRVRIALKRLGNRGQEVERRCLCGRTSPGGCVSSCRRGDDL